MHTQCIANGESQTRQGLSRSRYTGTDGRLAFAYVVLAVALLSVGCARARISSSGHKHGSSTQPVAEPGVGPVNGSSDRPDGPALLLASPQGLAVLDLGYIEELRSHGFEVDWTDSLDELTAERLARYNTVVLFETPGAFGARRGRPLAPEVDQRFRGLIEDFVERGGGVLLMPEELNAFQQRLSVLTDSWGARIPAELIVEADPIRNALLPRGSYQLPLASTDSIADSPVTQGVKNIWYPVSLYMMPLIVDRQWTVLVRASPTAHTMPLNLDAMIHHPPGIVQRSTPEQAPPLFAVRTMGQGRIALIAEFPQFSFYAGTKWIYDRVVLERGLRGVRSDFGRLLQNTLRWLSEPSVRTGRIGKAPRDRDETPPNAKQDLKDTFRAAAAPPSYDVKALDRVELPSSQHLYRGLIGARTLLSAGSGSVADYARAARSSGLDFVVFLERFEDLNEGEMKLLAQECSKHSGSDLSLLPGYSIATNVGNRMFFFGPDVALPPDLVLTGSDKSKLYIQEQKANGEFGAGGTQYLWWALRLHAPQAGYYDFAGSKHGIQLHDARIFAMAAVRFYRNGRLVEDIQADYLVTAAGTLAPTPVSINEVSSPQQLATQASRGRGLTYVVANNLTADSAHGVYGQGLRYTNQYDAMTTFVSSGPKILAWPATFRSNTYGAEGFVPERAAHFAPILVESAVGLQEVAIYDGSSLFRRIAVGGSRSYRATLVLDGSLQRNLTLVATDRAGGTALSFVRRSWSDGTAAPLFCGDHVNDCRSAPLLARGPWSLRLSDSPALPEQVAGVTWDGGPSATVSALGIQDTLPEVMTAAGSVYTLLLNPTPLLDFSDEGATGVTEARRVAFDARMPGVVLLPWNVFGPLSTDPPAIEHVQTYRQWLAPSEGAPPYGWAGYGVRQGGTASLFTSRLVFRRATSAQHIRLASFPRSPDVMLAILPVRGEPILIDLETTQPTHFTVGVGDAIAVYGKRPMNAHLLINRAAPIVLAVGQRIDLLAEQLPPTFVAGSKYDFEVAALAFSIAPAVGGLDELQASLRYLRDPSVVQLLRGSRQDSPGLIDLAPADSAVEFVAPKAPFDGVGPLRIVGMNARWSAGMLLKKGRLAEFYGPADDRYRGLAVSADGFAHIPLDAARGETHVLAGHPIVAEPNGRELFIQVTCLGGRPLRWHLSVNNPTARPVTTVLRQAIPLPGLSFARRELTLGPGELLNLQ